MGRSKKKLTAVFELITSTGFVGNRPQDPEHLIIADFKSAKHEAQLLQLIEEKPIEAIETFNHADFWEHRAKYRITIEKIPREL